MVRIQDVINHDADVYRELAGGLMTVNVLHGSANAIGGQNAVIKLKKGKPVEEWFIKDAPPGIKFALGENPKRSNSEGGYRSQRRYPATRMGVEETIREAFSAPKITCATGRNMKPKRDRLTAIAPRRDLSLRPLPKFSRANATSIRIAIAKMKFSCC